jgi:hypothetical protein
MECNASPKIHSYIIKINLTMRIILLLLVSCLTISCAHTRAPSVPVEYGDRQTLYFTGKGAAAGMMMDSLLGGTGVAIGIAIDEGIAKDIAAAIQKANPEFDIRKLVQEQLAIASNDVATKNWQSLVIEKYGFKVSDGDYVSPVLELTVNCKGSAKKIHFETDPANSDKTELELIKKNGKVAEDLLRQAVMESIQSKHTGSVCNK